MGGEIKIAVRNPKSVLTVMAGNICRCRRGGNIGKFSETVRDFSAAPAPNTGTLTG
ncbi:MULTISPECIES: hypothetical protein [unclassified Mesorhizobium]|uniref:hypothetical protein n=1 Tax=unclassified Mesorhizobium TaxID=325217 RepID=UPI0013E3DFE3|nr:MULTISPECIES: hypothetical protein [unclassified Mesorhizobium]